MAKILIGMATMDQHRQSPYVKVNVPQHCGVPLSLKAIVPAGSVRPMKGDIVMVRESGGGYKGWSLVSVNRPVEPEVPYNPFSDVGFTAEEMLEGIRRATEGLPTAQDVADNLAAYAAAFQNLANKGDSE